ncbi:hypothetical protein AB0B78_29820 [Streptomyces sp. NPDC040724]|uniref:hypothetical protein n=1 Tax=Streptomyces sp. NPDC040724 TaxID=3155612 RepID=UPI0033F761E9
MGRRSVHQRAHAARLTTTSTGCCLPRPSGPDRHRQRRWRWRWFSTASGSGCHRCPVAYVANFNANTVSVIDSASNTVVATVPVGDLPFGVAIGVVPRPAPALTLIKLTAGGTFTRGGQGAYTLTVTNTGDLPTDGSTVILTDTLPTGLTPVSFYGTGWTCTLAPLSCTRSDVLAPGASHPPLALTVRIAPNAPKQVTNTATVTGSGATGTSTATATTTVDRKQHPKPPHHDRPGHGKPDHGKPGHGKPGHDRPNHGHRPGPR